MSYKITCQSCGFTGQVIDDTCEGHCCGCYNDLQSQLTQAKEESDGAKIAIHKMTGAFIKLSDAKKLVTQERDELKGKLEKARDTLDKAEDILGKALTISTKEDRVQNIHNAMGIISDNLLED